MGVAAAATVAAFVAALVAPREVALQPVRLPQGLGAYSPLAAAERVHASAIALRKQALVSEFARPDDANWYRLRVDGGADPFTAASRAIGAALGRSGPQIDATVLAHPDYLEIVLRERISQATLRSQVRHGPDAIERLLYAGGEDLLLLATPLAAAALIIEDPRALSDGTRLDEALAMLARDVAANDDPRTLIVRASLDGIHGRCREALALYERVISAHPQRPRAYVLAADCHARLGERERALERLAQLRQGLPETPFALSLAGEAYTRLGDPERGLELLRAAHGRDGASAGNAVAIGEALLALHRPAEALKWLERHAPPDALRARWLAAIGLAQVRTGAGPAAEATAVALRGLEPSSAEATRIDAELAGAMKAWPQALGRFGALRLMVPTDGTAVAGEGLALLGLKRHAEAIDTYRRCTELAPWLAECRLGLGIALREADRAEEAMGPLAEAAALDARDPRIPVESARTLRALLRRDEAASQSARAELLAQRLATRLTLP